MPRGIIMQISECGTPRGFRIVSENVNFAAIWIQYAWFKWKYDFFFFWMDNIQGTLFWFNGNWESSWSEKKANK